MFLQALGVPGCRGNMVVMVAWQTAEGARASFNPLDTSLPMPGATNFNSVGVKNYVSQAQGLTATIRTLEGSPASYGYGPIVAGLRACADPMLTARAVRDSLWCHGCAGGLYVLELIPAVEAYFGH
jgi:hypothetical protein